MFPILAIDYGKKHIGIAVSDSKGLIASPLTVIHITKNRGFKHAIQEISEISKEYRIKHLLIGIPQAFNEDQIVNQTRIQKFIEKLTKEIDLPYDTVDESFSTREASDVILSAGSSAKKRKKDIDSIAAAVFLQSFLNSKR